MRGARARSGTARRLLFVLLAAGPAFACSRRDEPASGAASASKPVAAASAAPEPPPMVLFLPDAASGPGPAPALGPVGGVLRASVAHSGRCPADMVDVRGRFCIDRFEATLSDLGTGRLLSPF